MFKKLYLETSHIGLWLLSGAVTRQTVQVFQPNVSTLKSWSFPQFVQYW